MNEPLPATLERPRPLRLDWIPQVLFRPREALKEIANQTGSVWITPLLVLTLSAILLVIVAGPIKQAAAQSGQVELPPEFQYLSPDDQAKIQEAMSATQGPVFIYVFPGLSAVAGVWIGWLVIGGLLHLALTLLGGRGATGAAMNLVAWSALPFAVRDLVRAFYMLSAGRLISEPGLSGFVGLGESVFSLYLNKLLASVDIYLVWQIILLVIGVRAASGLSRSKAVTGVLAAVLLVIVLRTLLSSVIARLAGITVIQPFFF